MNDDLEPARGIGVTLLGVVALLVLILALAGCTSETAQRAAAAAGQRALGERPLVRGVDGGNASLYIIACPPNNARAAGMGELIRELFQQDELVIARSGGSARLSIDACPSGVPAPATGTRAR